MVDVVEEAVKVYDSGNYEQPIKPYIHPSGEGSRIIAMPVFLGGSFQAAGIKWISSYPKNISDGLPRSYSTTILNDAMTGEPICIFESAILSSIRTAAVSGLLLKSTVSSMVVGIIGCGRIGRMHAEMICEIYRSRVKSIT